MKDDRELRDTLRRACLEHLRLLAAPEACLAYERRVPIANVPAELACTWFDELSPESPGFRAAFDPDELSAIEVFHGIFEQGLRDLPDGVSVGDLLGLEAWRDVVDAAAECLRCLNGERPR